MLSVLAVLALVGGALAFKAKKFSGFCFYSSTAINGCTAAVAGKTTTTSGTGTSYYATHKAKSGGVCPTPPTGGYACANSYWSKDE